MKLNEIGEFGFIKSFENKFDAFIKGSDKGIGDDCAIITKNNDEVFVATTDLLIEDIHFLKSEISAKELGYKSLAVNLSDIAAMGAKPLYSFLSIGIPADTDVDFLDGFMEGYYELSNKYQIPLMGGDTTKSSDKLVINVLAMGECEKSNVKMRSMAKDGDVVCVSGNLGDSGAGLKVLLENLERTEINKFLVNRHHLPEPRIKEGDWLSKQVSVHAMMDISDGISSDLKHILNKSGKQAEINLEKLPLSNELKTASEINNWDAFSVATSGGEDYELLFTMSASDFDGISKDFEKEFSKPIYCIGRIFEGEEKINFMLNGELVDSNSMGFDHFAK